MVIIKKKYLRRLRAALLCERFANIFYQVSFLGKLSFRMIVRQETLMRSLTTFAFGGRCCRVVWGVGMRVA